MSFLSSTPTPFFSKEEIMKERKRLYKQNSVYKEKQIIYNKKYRQRDYVKEKRKKEKQTPTYKAYAKEYSLRVKNKEKMKAYQEEYRKKNTERRKLWEKEHVGKYKLYYKNWLKNNPEKSLKSQIKYFKKLGLSLNMLYFEVKIAFLYWSKIIKKRDEICQVCGSTDRLNTHHIFPKIKYPLLSLNVNNGITLCKEHHNEVHRLNGWLIA